MKEGFWRGGGEYNRGGGGGRSNRTPVTDVTHHTHKTGDSTMDSDVKIKIWKIIRNETDNI